MSKVIFKPPDNTARHTYGGAREEAGKVDDINAVGQVRNLDLHRTERSSLRYICVPTAASRDKFGAYAPSQIKDENAAPYWASRKLGFRNRSESAGSHYHIGRSAPAKSVFRLKSMRARVGVALILRDRKRARIR